MSNLKGVIYVSTLRKDITLDDVKTLAEVFSISNKRNDISGVLMCASGTVMQYIEGDTSDIDKLYSSILRDVRHYNIITLFEEKIEERLYEDWGLRFEKTEIEKLVRVKEKMDTKKNVLSIFNSFARVNLEHWKI